MSKKYSEAFPNSKRSEGGEQVGIQASGFIDKKGTPSGMDAKFNYLPPGGNIENQECSDVQRTMDMPMKTITPSGFPGDGW